MEPITTIEKRRRDLGWSQGEVAMFLGVSIAAVSLWESRKRRPSRPLVKLISRLLSVTPQEIDADYPARTKAA